ncbi:MAG: ATP-binding cassette domain-containing protein, partial [Flavobacteriaceae bacterium]|nr:ATP-binding cassette domain-containing protein [Flavobacteriaceae bacterium]
MAETVLQLKDVSIYQGNNLVLSSVNFEMKRGDFVYLIGKTGTGKSSFLKILYGDLDLREGEGEIVGFDLANLKERDIPFLRRKLGVVFQDFLLLNDRTVNDNLEFVLRATGWKDQAEIKAKIAEVLGKVDMKEQG